MVSHAARPIVNEGKMMWNEIVKANCSLERSSAVTSIAASYQRQKFAAARSTISSSLPLITAFVM